MRQLRIYIAIFILTIVSCKKVLDIEPENFLQNEDAITTPADLNNLVESIYDGMQNGLTLGGNRYIYGELFSDDADVLESQLNAFGTLEIYNRTMTSQISDLRNMWREGYSTINRANNVIRVIENGSLETHENYNPQNFAIYHATALFARAAIHFEMVRFWGSSYDTDQSGGNSQLGIPYRLQPTLEGPEGLDIARNSVEEVYSNAISDLQTSIDLLTPFGNGSAIYTDWHRHKVDVWSAKAYLSRILFFKGEYTEASAICEEIISSGNFSLSNSPKENFIQSAQNYTDGQIFQLTSIAEDQSGNPAWGYSRFGSPLFYPKNDVMDKFHLNDSRLTDSEGYLYVSFFGDSTISKYDLPNAVNGINMCVLRLAEVYLNAAEANLSPGGNGNSTRSADLYAELYQLRTGTLPAIPSTADSLLVEIQKERRLELMFEGDRYHNLKRMKLPLRGGVPYNDPSVLFKIPQEEMSGNSLMIQNP